MFVHSDRARTVGNMTPPRWSAALVAAMALFAAACNESTSPALPTTSPSTASVAAAASPSVATVAVTAAEFAVMANQSVACTNGAGDRRPRRHLHLRSHGRRRRPRVPSPVTVHVGGGLARLSFNYFLDAHDVLAPMTGQSRTVLAGTLAGVTLAPGAYCFPTAATLTGVLTLDGPASGIWLFRIGDRGTGAITADNFQVVMAGNARPCNATWWDQGRRGRSRPPTSRGICSPGRPSRSRAEPTRATPGRRTT